LNYFKRSYSTKILGIFTIFLLFVSFSHSQSERNEGENIFVHIYYSLVDSGEEEIKEGNFEKAIELFEQALLWAREELPAEEEVRCYERLGLLYWNIGELNKSSVYYNKASLLSNRLNLPGELNACQTYLEIYNLYNEGKKHRALKDFDESIKNFSTAIDIARKIKSEAHELKCLRQLSITYWELYDFQKFLELNEAALGIAKKINHKKEEGRCLNNMGIFYKCNNDFSKALYFYEKSLQIALSLNDKIEESILFNNIGNIFREIGDHERALRNLNKSLLIDRQFRNLFSISISTNNIGSIYHNLGVTSGNNKYLEEALSYYNQCLKLTKESIDDKIAIRALNNIGLVYSDFQDYGQAMQYFNLGYNRAKEANYLEAMGMIMVNRGVAYFHVEEYEKALECLDRSIEIGSSLRSSQIQWEAFFWQGRCYEINGEFHRAINSYENALNIVDDLRSQITLDTHKTGFVRDKLIVYKFLLELLYKVHTDQPQLDLEKDLFHLVERAKARSFLESIKESRVDIAEKLTPELKKSESEISRDISSITTELSQSNLTMRKRRELVNLLEKKEDEYLELITRIRLEIPDIADIVSPKPCSLERLRETLLDNKTAIVEYFLSENRSFMFVMTKNDLKLYSLPPRSAIENSIKAYLKILSQLPKERLFRGVLASKRICKELMLSDGEIPHHIENLIIIPDGILYYLPFETLIASDPNGKTEIHYLIEKYQISYSPSSSSLLFLLENETKGKESKGLLAFANPSYDIQNRSNNHKNHLNFFSELYSDNGFNITPLPFSQKEVSEISKYFPEDKRNLFFAKKAKEEIVKSISLRDYRVIHFACHGFMDEEIPFRSALILALDDDVNEDGFLQAREIYNLRMQAELIVLSACQTGRGKLEKWEGVFGLPRIFFYAGAKSVLSSLWPVEDRSTAQFMRYFYYYLSKGKNKASALRSAKLKMISSGFSHPFYWGAFVLNGDFSSNKIFE